MGFVDKEGYERKREYAARKAEAQKENTNLTEDQHDVMAWLCGVRHFIHCNMDSYFLSESATGEQISNYIFGYGSDNINNRLKEVNLPVIDWLYSDIDCISDSTWELDYDSIEEAQEEAFKQILEMHNQLESYIRKIDETYGTEYAPSGATRIY